MTSKDMALPMPEVTIVHKLDRDVKSRTIVVTSQSATTHPPMNFASSWQNSFSVSIKLATQLLKLGPRTLTYILPVGVRYHP